MKIGLVCVEDNLMSIGFRKIGAYVKKLHPDTKVHYVPYKNSKDLMTVILGEHGTAAEVPEESLREIAEPLAKFDVVGFSAMSGYSELTRDIIAQIRKVNPKIYIIWGGLHPIIDPDDAIQYVDAICTGEGEFAFEQFFDAFKHEKDFTKTKNFWFHDPRDPGKIIKNDFLPLMSSAEMAALPLPHYGAEEKIYEPKRGYVDLDVGRYVNFNGLSYNTVWSIGCPFKCTYCGNTKFIENDKIYRILRHPGVQYVIDEVKQASARHPHISTVVFHDDSFMALPMETLKHFAEEYKKQVGIPFAVYGLIPNYVREDKLKVLLSAGLNRVRMGIQNGSERILQFYERPTPIPRVLEATKILNKYSKYMIPPTYDIIVDNPVETLDDVKTNLEFLHNLPRPYTMNIFSLKSIPNTKLEKQMKDFNISLEKIDAGYVYVKPTLANALVYLTVTFKLPKWLFRKWLKSAKPIMEKQTSYPRLIWLTHLMYVIRRGFGYLRFMDFSEIPGKTGYWMWKFGIIGFWRRHFVEKLELGPEPISAPEVSSKAA